MSNLRRQGIKSIVYTYIGVGLGFISSIIILPRIISKDEYGLIQILIALPILFTEYIGLGFSAVMARVFVYFKDSKNNHNGFMFLSLIWLLIGLIVFLLAFYFFRGYFIDEKNAVLLQPYIYFAIPLSIASHIYLTLERYLRYTQFNASFSIFLKEIGLRVGILISAFLYYIKLIQFNQFIFLYCFSQITPAAFLLIKLLWKGEISFKPQLSFVKKGMVIKMIRISIFAIGIGVFTNLAHSFAQLTLGKLISLAAVSSYAVAVTISGLISVPMRVTHSLTDPMMRMAFAAGDHAQVLEIYKKSCLIQTIIGLFFYLCLLLNIDHIVHILPSNYTDTKFMILVIGLGTLFDMITGANDVLIGVSPKYYYGAIFPVALALFTIAFNLVYIPLYGLRGAAVAMMCTYFLYNILRFLFILILLKMQPYDVQYLKIFALAILIGILVYSIPAVPSFILDMIIRIALISLLWIGAVYKFNLSVDINNMINLVLKKIKNTHK